MSAALRCAAGWAVLAACYLLFAGQASRNEAIAGAAFTLAAAIYARALGRTASRPIGLRAPWPRLVWSVARALPADTVKVAAAILRGGHGAALPQPFHLGGTEDAGRRALVTLALSLAPNGFVTEIGPGALLLHRLSAAPESRDRDWPL